MADKSNLRKACVSLAQLIIKNNLKTKDEINKLKNKVSKQFNLKKIPTNAQISSYIDEKTRLKLRTILSIKPTRTISGVQVIALMTKPFPCPHGKCTYCPGGVKSEFGDVPQSYTGKEPATLRGIRNHYDSYLQTFNRLEQYFATDKFADKIELIIMGGTFPSIDKTYQEDFVKYAIKALNDFSTLFFKNKKFDYKKFNEFFLLPGEIGNPDRVKLIHGKLLKIRGETTLEAEQKKNEKAMIRCVGLTIETRPDQGLLKQGNEMLRFGATRVEIGVQSVYDDVLKKIERGHTVQDTINSFRILKDLGFKINVHYMPGLPGSNPKKDLEGLKTLFSNENFRPDMLKIYPCMVMLGTKLYDDYKKKRFKPIGSKDALELILKMKQFVPPYVRIMRVQRDIPTYVTSAGVSHTNLRQMIEEEMKRRKLHCQCIRCREIGRNLPNGKPKLHVLEYPASKGKEFFISFDDDSNNLYGFIRMRFPSESLRKEIPSKTAIIRELHVFSPASQIGKVDLASFQHKGLGTKLLEKAEEIAKKNKFEKMIIISGIGVREYYKKFGYKIEGVYMGKKI